MELVRIVDTVEQALLDVLDHLRVVDRGPRNLLCNFLLLVGEEAIGIALA